ncbi:hypothetical protein [Moraxella lacunata]
MAENAVVIAVVLVMNGDNDRYHALVSYLQSLTSCLKSPDIELGDFL